MQKLKLLLLVFLLILAGCTSTRQSGTSLKPYWRFEAGLNKGGIVENTDFTGLAEVEPDAYTGATRTGYNAGAHCVIPLLNHGIETGIVYMFSPQTFSYKDDINGYSGERNFATSQLMMPLTLNLSLFRQKAPEGLIHLKLGYALQLNIVGITSNGTLPEYSLNRWSNGFTVGFTATPFRFQDGSKLGFFIDGYRGTRIYEDFYNQKPSDMPGTSYLKYGIIYQLPVTQKIRPDK
ncbi:MAG: hypothetical protein IPH20_10205 [Bacteroidales bacterium]|nr:hypothetical protein [Bacteroidales bacterium]